MLAAVAARLSELLGRPVEFAEDCIGEAATRAIEKAEIEKEVKEAMSA